MKYNPEIHHRRSIRLKGYDYSQAGAHFVTICTQSRKCLFGEITDKEMRLNEAGIILQAAWDALPDHYPFVELDAWIIMPNHVHGIIVLGDEVEAGLKPAPTTKTRHELSEIVRALKSFSSRRINERHRTSGEKLWQRNYWEHIVRNESELNRSREYIRNNPAQWELDKLHPNQPGFGRAGAVGAGLKPAPTTCIREPIVRYDNDVPDLYDAGWVV